jgi:branched-chain amino acid transport system substrate-binding protein
MYRRFAATLFACVLIVSLVAGCAPAQADTYKIGLVVSITGPASSLGIPERDTALMLLEQVNKAGGIKGPDGKMHTLEIIVEDDASDASKATLAAKKLVEQDNVAVLVGSSGSPASMAMIETATKNETPMISLAASSTIVNPLAERKWIFKTAQESKVVVEVQVDYLKAKGITKIASLAVNNAFGKDSVDAMNALYPAAGIQILGSETFQPGDKDFTAQLTKLKGLNPEAVIVHATSGEGAPIAVQYRSLGFDVPLINNHGIGNQDFIKLAADSAEKVVFPIGKLLVVSSLPDSDPQKAVLLKYITDYTAYTNGKAMSTFGGHGYDAIQIAIAGFQAVGADRAKLRDYFETGVSGYVGVTGTFNMSASDHVGIGKASLVLVEIEGGTWKYIPADQYPNVP